MRWTNDRPDVGDTRKREAFLWLRKTINGETRWLERARWEECYGSRLPLDHPDITEWEKSCAKDPLLGCKEWRPFRWLPVARNRPDPPYKLPTVSTTPRPPIAGTGES